MMPTSRFSRSLTACLAGLLLMLGTVSAWATVSVRDVRLHRAPDHTRLVLDLTGPVKHTLFTLKNPERLVVDIEDTRLDSALDGLALEDTPIRRVRTGVKDRTDLRVVLDLSQTVKPRSFVLKPIKHYGDRLVVDLYDPVQQKTADTVKTADEVQSQRRDIVIAIDAGHGGEDPGALGPRGIREKDVVMAIAREVEKRFARQRGFAPRLIRTGDYYISLAGRRQKAREHRADFFVSIHADAFTNPKARGSSVYAVSRRGATSAMGRFLAEKENAADLVGGVRLGSHDAQVREVLLDLSMTYTQQSSQDAGSLVLGEMGSFARLHSHQVERAAFAVLKQPDIPSILVETGFISNPTEARLLSSRHHQQKLADAIVQGITYYFERNPPDGTWVAWKQKQKGQQVYVIARGDTLSGIAQRFGVGISALRRENRLSSDMIRVGQRLRIPAS